VRIAFLASRKGYLKVMGSLIQAAIERGHEALLLTDPGERKPGEATTPEDLAHWPRARVLPIQRGASLVAPLTGARAEALVGPSLHFVLASMGPEGDISAMRAAGVEVEDGVLAEEAEAINETWTFSVRQQRPFVTWKFAATLDGRSAAADGSARWITGPEARADVHRLRASCDTVLVGTGTVEADNPRLTARDEHDRPKPPDRQPLRVVMGHRELDPDSRVFDASARTVVLPTHDPRLALAALYAVERQHVFLEGGPTLAAAFLSAGLVDEVIAYLAPALLGSGSHAIGDLGIRSMEQIRRFRLVEATPFGDDVRLTLRPRTPARARLSIVEES